MKKAIIKKITYLFLSCLALSSCSRGEKQPDIKPNENCSQEITIGANGHWFINGTDTGINASGENGKDGAKIYNDFQNPEKILGKDGDLFINSISFDVFEKKNDNWVLLGNIKGLSGNDGVSVVSAQINSEGNLIIVLSNGNTLNAGHVTTEYPTTPKVYRVNFYLNDELVDTCEVNENSKIDKPSEEKFPGYCINNWHLDGYSDRPWIFSGYYADRVTEDIDLYADFTYKNYTINFVDEKFGKTIEPMEVTYQHHYSIDAVLSENGYSFKGWVCETEKDFELDGIYSYTHDLTLKSVWDVNTYKATFNPMGGYSNINENIFTFGMPYSLPVPTRENYNFVGWFDANGKQYENEGIWTTFEDVELFAKWVSHWKGKKWVALGTSITSNKDTNNDGVITGQYSNILADISGLSQTNYGVEGAVIGGHPFLYSLLPQYKDQIANADLITIEGGVNDWYGGRLLGNVNDIMPYFNDWRAGGINLITGYSTGTFAGSCYSLFNNLKNINPNATIIALTDCSGPDGGICSADAVNIHGLHLSDYNNMMKQIADLTGIHFIDVGSECGIKGSDIQYFTDHIHLNEDGGRIYANYLWEKLKNISQKQSEIKEVVTVTFKTNGEVVNTQKISKGSSAYSPYPGTIEKHDFLGWDKSLANITEDTIINSLWSERKSTISFNTNGGTEIKDIVGFPGTPIDEILDPTKEGYLFDGWDNEVPNVIPDKDLTLNAFWREKDNLFTRLTETKNTRMIYSGGDAIEAKSNSYNLSDYIPLNNKKLIIEFDVDVVRTGNAYSSCSINIIPFNEIGGNAPQYSIYYETFTGQKDFYKIEKTGNHYKITWSDYKYIRIAYEKNNLHNLTVKYPTYNVSFTDGEKIISSQTIVYGENAIAPETPMKENFVFDGWDKSFNNVKSDLVISARWRDIDELFILSESLNNTFLNSTENGSANGYITSNYIECNRNDEIRIDVTRKGSGIGDFRIALGASQNNTYLATWQIGSTSKNFNENGVLDSPHIYIVREIVDNHTYFCVKNINSSMHFIRVCYQTSYVLNLSIKAA